MLAHASQTLTQDGHAVDVSDLYAMDWNPLVTVDDFTDPVDPLNFNLQAEQKHAAETGSFSPDILAEQRKLVWSDLLILQFPLWWYAVPAILKGWIDRVLTYGFAYGQGQSLRGRRALLVITTGGPATPLTREKQRVLSDILDYLQRGTLYFCGFDVLPPFAVYGGAHIPRDNTHQVLLQYTQLLRAMWTVDPLRF
jgi:NAD(P)H dehydrogenase (quinone)